MEASEKPCLPLKHSAVYYSVYTVKVSVFVNRKKNLLASSSSSSSASSSWLGRVSRFLVYTQHSTHCEKSCHFSASFTTPKALYAGRKLLRTWILRPLLKEEDIDMRTEGIRFFAS